MVHHRDGWNVGGMAKGAGMLAPSLATMLVVLTTDALVDAEQLDLALRRATALTFDRLDVDGATSTNDTVLLLSRVPASSASTRQTLTPLSSPRATTSPPNCWPTPRASPSASSSRSPGPSTMIRPRRRAHDRPGLAGQDRVVRLRSQLGPDPGGSRHRPIELDPDKIAVSFNGNEVCRDGVGVAGAREVDLSGQDIHLLVDLGIGTGGASIRTSDLSHAYVEENSAYSS